MGAVTETRFFCVCVQFFICMKIFLMRGLQIAACQQKCDFQWVTFQAVGCGVLQGA